MTEKNKIAHIVWPDGFETWAVPKDGRFSWEFFPQPDSLHWRPIFLDRWKRLAEIASEGRTGDPVGDIRHTVLEWAKANGAKCEFAPRPPLPPGAIS